MNLQEIVSVKSIADKHVLRINQAIEHLKNIFPLSSEKVQSLDETSILYIEMLTSRFSKLQDYLGHTVINTLFEVESENTVTWTMIDKLNKLEQYGILDDAHDWREMCKSRNFLAHEYPDDPVKTAESLNKIYSFVPLLLDINQKIFAKLLKDL